MDRADAVVPYGVRESELVGRADAILYSFATCSGEEGLRCAPRRMLERVD